MYALIHRATNTLQAFVETPAGYDPAEFDALPFDGDPLSVIWDGATFIARPPTPAEETEIALGDDARWQAMRSASPAQVESWLTSNVTDLTSARRVLKLLILAIQIILRTR